MNLKTDIYDGIISAATQILEDNIEPSSLKNSKFEDSKEIKTKYPQSVESRTADKYIALAEESLR